MALGTAVARSTHWFDSVMLCTTSKRFHRLDSMIVTDAVSLIKFLGLCEWMAYFRDRVLACTLSAATLSFWASSQ